MRRRYPCALCLALAVALLDEPARAADTIETWDPAAVDLEFYTTAEGLGRPSAERAFVGEMVLGYGIIPGLSAYLTAALAADGTLGAGVVEPALGIFGTPLDTAAVDLDLLLDVSLSGDLLHLAPGIELNFDADPDLLTWGLYLRGGLDVSNRTVAADPATGGAGPKGLAWGLAATAGAYWRPHADHQLLLELDAAFALNPATGERAAELGGLALGYNVGVHEAIELVTQVRVELPQAADESPSVALTAGFIATLP